MPARVKILALILAGAVVATAAAPAQPPHTAPAQQGRPTATPSASSGAQARAAIDAALITHWAKIQNWMTTYAAGHGGRYFQALRSHTTPPANGAASAPDRLTLKPTDQTETLAQLWNGASLPSIVPFALTVNVYDGPAGAGWEAVIEMIDAGQLWRRVVNSGPETYRDSAWSPVVVLE